MGQLEMVLGAPRQPPKAHGNKDQSGLSCRAQPYHVSSRTLGCKDRQGSSETDWATVLASVTRNLSSCWSDIEIEEKALSQVWFPRKQTLRWGCACKFIEEHSAGE